MARMRHALDALLRRGAHSPALDPSLRALLEAASPGLALLDAEDRLVAWNAEFAGICGPMQPPREHLPLGMLLALEGRKAALSALANGQKVPVALASEVAPRVEAERRPLRAPGSGAVLRFALLPPRTSDQEAAAARLQSVGALAGGIAHDFNNLLSAITGSAEAVLARDPGEESTADLRQILESAGRGAALVRQLLAFARQQALRPRVVELNAAVAGMGELLRRLLGRQIRLTITLEEPVRRVRIDPTQLDQVILNLALNARDAMPEGGSLAISTDHAVVLSPETIGSEMLPAGRYAVLQVADSGRGIPPEVLPRIFDPFFTTRRDQGGTGLGLATVHGIVRQSGGFITVDSKPGEGTRFRIWLPRHDGPVEAPPAVALPPVAPARREASAPPPPPPPPPPAASAPSEIRPPVNAPVEAMPPPSPPSVALPSVAAEATAARPPAGSAPPPVGRVAVLAGGGPVLLVEDEPPLLRLAERALRRAGFDVLSAPSGEEALELLERGAPVPRALVSDVVMPGLDGLELTARLRQQHPDLPVLLVSGYAEAALGRDLAAERIRLVSKPYAMATLVSELRSILPAEGVEVS